MLMRQDTFFLENALRSFFSEPFALPRAALPTDIVETEDAMEIIAELPGVDREQVEVTVEDGWLALRARQASGSHVAELARRYRLGPGYAADGVTASLENGVLRVRVPKRAPEILRIPVRAGDDAGPEVKPGVLERIKRAVSRIGRKAG